VFPISAAIAAVQQNKFFEEFCRNLLKTYGETYDSIPQHNKIVETFLEHHAGLATHKRIFSRQNKMKEGKKRKEMKKNDTGEPRFFF
jgi:hypothetical protein